MEDHSYIKDKLEYKEESKQWVLYVAKVETLAFEKLHRRNIAFEELAEYHDAELYDGWDVEKV